jgi:hypothetical protein
VALIAEVVGMRKTRFGPRNSGDMSSPRIRESLLAWWRRAVAGDGGTGMYDGRGLGC